MDKSLHYDCWDLNEKYFENCQIAEVRAAVRGNLQSLCFHWNVQYMWHELVLVLDKICWSIPLVAAGYSKPALTVGGITWAHPQLFGYTQSEIWHVCNYLWTKPVTLALVGEQVRWDIGASNILLCRLESPYRAFLLPLPESQRFFLPACDAQV